MEIRTVFKSSDKIPAKTQPQVFILYHIESPWPQLDWNLQLDQHGEWTWTLSEKTDKNQLTPTSVEKRTTQTFATNRKGLQQMGSTEKTKKACKMEDRDGQTYKRRNSGVRDEAGIFVDIINYWNFINAFKIGNFTSWIKNLNLR